MTRRQALPLVAFGTVLALLAVVALRGDETDRAGAGLSLVVIVASMALAVRQQRNEHEPDEMPSNLSLLAELFEGRSVFAIALLAFVVLFLALDGSGVLGAALAAVALVVNAFVATRRILARPGIERDQFLLATSIAFGVTMAACAAWSMFQALAEVPQLGMEAPWMLGLISWGAASVVLRRRAA